MDKIKVYGIDMDKINCPKNPNKLSDEDFIKESERQGLIWNKKDFEESFNDDSTINNLIIRII
jgi:hypothetical protein